MAQKKIAAKASRIDWQRILQPLSDHEQQADFWVNLLESVYLPFQKVDNSLFEEELKTLKQALKQKKLGITQQASFKKDFAFFSEFITTIIESHHQAPFLPGNPSANVQDILEQMMLTFGTELLQKHKKATRLIKDTKLAQKNRGDDDCPPLTEKDIIKLDNQLTAMQRMFSNPDEQLDSPRNKTILAAIFCLLKQLLARVFDSPPPNAMEHLRVLNKLWDIVKKHNLLSSVLNTSDSLFNFDKKINDINIQKEIKAPSAFSPSYSLLSHPILKLIDNVDNDINTFETWGKALLRKAILQHKKKNAAGEIKPAKGLKACLEAFQTIRQEIQHYSATLYQCRMKAEQAWRMEDDYLKDLNALDRHLDKMNQRLLALQSDLLGELIDVDKAQLEEMPIKDKTDLQIVYQCLATLLSKPMADLETVSWAEWSCYCQALTEKTIAYEMNRRLDLTDNRKKYNVRNLFTQTDYLLVVQREHYATQYSALKKVSSRTAADKILPRLSDECQPVSQALKEIADYCAQEINTNLERYERVYFAWYAGQWYAAKPNVEEEASSEERERLGKLQPQIIDQPSSALNLKAIALHREYHPWAKEQPSLVKIPREPEEKHRHHFLYTLDHDAFAIHEDKEERLRTAANIEGGETHLKIKEAQEIRDAEIAKTQEAERQTEEFKRQTEEFKRQTEEFKRQTEAERVAREGAEALLEEAVKREITMYLQFRLQGLDNPPAIENVRQDICQTVATHYKKSIEEVTRLMSGIIQENPALLAIINRPAAQTGRGRFFATPTARPNQQEEAAATKRIGLGQTKTED